MTCVEFQLPSEKTKWLVHNASLRLRAIRPTGAHVPLGTVEGLGSAVKLVNSAHPMGVKGHIFLQVTH